MTVLATQVKLHKHDLTDTNGRSNGSSDGRTGLEGHGEQTHRNGQWKRVEAYGSVWKRVEAYESV